MYLLYMDESGTPDIPGNTPHFILAGLSIPIWHWKNCDQEISEIKKQYDLNDAEIHTAWILRNYIEQSKIIDYASMNYQDRRNEVEKYRKAEIFRLQRSGKPKLYKQTKKNYRNTKAYCHLTYDERKQFITQIAYCISNWGFARLFAECIDKITYNPSLSSQDIDEQAFEQVVSRFQQYLQNISQPSQNYYGLLIHDNNLTVAKRHTELMKRFHKRGTLWTKIKNIIETPLFVNSELTCLVQIADLCAYAIRRYLENNEHDLFDIVFQRGDRIGNSVVGIRHFISSNCNCKICTNHK